VGDQKKKEVKPVKVEGVKEWEVEKTLNKSEGSCEVFSMIEGIYSRE